MSEIFNYLDKKFNYISKIKEQGSKAICRENARINNFSFEIAEQLTSNNWKYIGSGRHRKVYKKGDVVLKIPVNLDGVEANVMERKLYLSRRKEGIFAPCRLLSNGCLMMVALSNTLDCCDYDKNYPSWVQELNDGPQIGIDRNGRLLAYDYAEEYY